MAGSPQIQVVVCSDSGPSYCTSLCSNTTLLHSFLSTQFVLRLREPSPSLHHASLNCQPSNIDVESITTHGQITSILHKKIGAKSSTY